MVSSACQTKMQCQSTQEKKVRRTVLPPSSAGLLSVFMPHISKYQRLVSDQTGVVFHQSGQGNANRRQANTNGVWARDYWLQTDCVPNLSGSHKMWGAKRLFSGLDGMTLWGLLFGRFVLPTEGLCRLRGCFRLPGWCHLSSGVA
jgi:hypothetical protein